MANKQYPAPIGLYPKLHRVLKPSGSGPSLGDILSVAEQAEKIFPEADKDDIIRTNKNYFARLFDKEADKFLDSDYFRFAGSLIRMKDWLDKYKALGGDNNARAAVFHYLKTVESKYIKHSRKRPNQGRLKKPAREHLKTLLKTLNDNEARSSEAEVQASLAAKGII